MYRVSSGCAPRQAQSQLAFRPAGSTNSTALAAERTGTGRASFARGSEESTDRARLKPRMAQTAPRLRSASFLHAGERDGRFLWTAQTTKEAFPGSLHPFWMLKGCSTFQEDDQLQILLLQAKTYSD